MAGRTRSQATNSKNFPLSKDPLMDREKEKKKTKSERSKQINTGKNDTLQGPASGKLAPKGGRKEILKGKSSWMDGM